MSADQNKFGFIIRDAIIVGVFGVTFPTIFFSSDFEFHFIWGLWCSFIGLAGFLHAPAHFYSEAKPNKKTWVWIIYWYLLLVIATWFFVWSYKIAHPPHVNSPELKPVEAVIPQALPPHPPESESAQPLPIAAAQPKPVEVVKTVDTNELREIVVDAISGQQASQDEQIRETLQTALGKTQPIPVKEEIIDFLNSRDKQIIIKLKHSKTSVRVEGNMETEDFSVLNKLASEPGAWKYIQVIDAPHNTLMMDNGIWEKEDVTFWLYPALLENE